MDTKVSDFLYNCNLEWRSRSSWYQNVELKVTLVVLIIIPSLNKTGMKMTEYKPLLFRTGEERTLRLHASLPATRWPRHACTRPDRVSAERVVQAFFVPYKNAGLRFPLSLWSCVRFSICLGMIFATWLKEISVYRAVQDILACVFFLGRNREYFVRTDIWHPPWASPRFTCRAGLLCCLWKHGSTVPVVLWSCVRFGVCLGMIFSTWLKETFVYHAVQDVLACAFFLGRNPECLVRTVPAAEFCEYPVPK